VREVAKKAKCETCKIKFNIVEKDQTPLCELECPYCHGPVTRIYVNNSDYFLAKGEPILKTR
jgi:Zn finger protein HypA/HybF involved in hydrogenase expression